MIRANSARRAFSFAELVVVMLLMTLIIGLLIIGVQKLRTIERGPGGYNQTLGNLKQLTLACHGFMDVHKTLPPAFDKFGKTNFLASVHVYLLPFVEGDKMYELYVQAHGKGKVGNAIVPQFISPGDSTLKNDGAGVQSFAANLRAFSDKGWNTPFQLDMPALGAIEPGAALIPGSFPDGTANTLAFTTKLAECGDGGSRYAASPDSKFAAFFGQNAAQVPADPSDITATFQLAPDERQCQPTPLRGQSYSVRYIWVSLFDGSARRVSPETSARTWNLAVQPNDGLELGRDWDH
jgi:hypothetical protein